MWNVWKIRNLCHFIFTHIQMQYHTNSLLLCMSLGRTANGAKTGYSVKRGFLFDSWHNLVCQIYYCVRVFFFFSRFLPATKFQLLELFDFFHEKCMHSPMKLVQYFANMCQIRNHSVFVGVRVKTLWILSAWFARKPCHDFAIRCGDHLNMLLHQRYKTMLCTRNIG